MSNWSSFQDLNSFSHDVISAERTWVVAVHKPVTMVA
jgi:hypothetical protein